MSKHPPEAYTELLDAAHAINTLKYILHTLRRAHPVYINMSYVRFEHGYVPATVELTECDAYLREALTDAARMLTVFQRVIDRNVVLNLGKPDTYATDEYVFHRLETVNPVSVVRVCAERVVHHVGTAHTRAREYTKLIRGSIPAAKSRGGATRLGPESYTPALAVLLHDTDIYCAALAAELEVQSDGIFFVHQPRPRDPDGNPEDY